MDAPTYVGIDVSKDTLDVATLPAGEAWTTANDDDAIAALTVRVTALGPALVVLEASGKYEAPCAAALAAAGVPVAVVNPRQTRDFAKSTGQLAKTDSLDAAMLALFAERVRPEPRALPDTESEALAAILGGDGDRRASEERDELVLDSSEHLALGPEDRRGVKRVERVQEVLDVVLDGLVVAREEPGAELADKLDGLAPDGEVVRRGRPAWIADNGPGRHPGPLAILRGEAVGEGREVVEGLGPLGVRLGARERLGFEGGEGVGRRLFVSAEPSRGQDRLELVGREAEPVGCPDVVER